jgi:N-acetylmuramoyl-L-alanine amidase
MESGQAALERLTTASSKVSAHYVVFEDGRIVQCVPEAMRAWHAGVTSWTGDTDINSRSIGIEICNPGHEFGYPDFPPRQIAATITLCRSILTRNIVRPEHILAHSDVAPSRKQDPGEKFPWKRLAQSGVGLWVEAGAVTDAPLSPNDSGTKVTELQRMLADYGYGIDTSGRYDMTTTEVVTAFQRHFRPSLVDGIADAMTVQTLRKLLIARDAQPQKKPPLAKPLPAAPDAQPEAKPVVAAAAPKSSPPPSMPSPPEPAAVDRPFAAGIQPAPSPPTEPKPGAPKAGFLRGLWPTS